MRLTFQKTVKTSQVKNAKTPWQKRSFLCRPWSLSNGRREHCCSLNHSMHFASLIWRNLKWLLHLKDILQITKFLKWLAVSSSNTTLNLVRKSRASRKPHRWDSRMGVVGMRAGYLPSVGPLPYSHPLPCSVPLPCSIASIQLVKTYQSLRLSSC